MVTWQEVFGTHAIHNTSLPMHHDLPDDAVLVEALYRLDTEVTPGEVHGTACGLLCANTGAPMKHWQQILWPDCLAAAQDEEVFAQLHEVTRSQLNDPECDFQLLLPDDGSSLNVRVHALGDWCQGFLIGLSLGGVKDFSPLPTDAREVAEDLVEIARAGTSYHLDDSEEDEQAYVQLVEYLRVGVLLINEELHPVQPSSQAESTLH
jgi:uncharacterized protein YgfB (UPF0149 family)